MITISIYEKSLAILDCFHPKSFPDSYRTNLFFDAGIHVIFILLRFAGWLL